MDNERIRIRSTNEVLRGLRAANPGVELTENSIRGVLRRGLINAPAMLGGAFLWRDGDVQSLADALGLEGPDDGQR